MTDTNNGIGILGNTQAAAAAEATTARQATKVAWQEKTSTHIGVAVVLITVAYLLMVGLEWNFFLKLLTGLAVFWAAGKVSSWVGPKLAWHWTGILRAVGASIIALALAQSGFYALFSQGVNAIEQKAAKAAGVFSPPKPLTAAELAAKQEHIRQQGVLAAEKQKADAAANAAASEAARLATANSSNLPTSVVVPHCDNGMSDTIPLPAEWKVKSGWGGGSTTVEYLSNGIWKTATELVVTDPVEAVRYCTKSTANAEIGTMTLLWKPY
jgi:hypothetical protein